MASADRRAAGLLLMLLLCVDVALIALHFFNGLVADGAYSGLHLGTEHGYGELFEYVKLVSIVVVLLVTARKSATPQYLAWVFAFGMLLLDDALELHERTGLGIASALGLPGMLFGLRGEDIGELAAAAAIGGVLLAPLAWAYRRGTDDFRRVSRDFALLFAVLVFFGVALDAVHVIVQWSWTLKFGIGAAEDAGELMTISFMLWYAFLVMRRGGDPGLDLWGRALKWGTSPISRISRRRSSR